MIKHLTVSAAGSHELSGCYVPSLRSSPALLRSRLHPLPPGSVGLQISSEPGAGAGRCEQSSRRENQNLVPKGDISSVVDEHFSRALSQPSSYSPSCTSSKAPRSSGPWRDGSFPMSQRSFPASFWNSAYQTPVPAPLGSPLAAAHSELPFAAADPYSPAALHGHLHQGAAEPWHHAHPHHGHPHHPYALGGALGAQAAAYPRPAAVHEVYAPHFDPRYGPLLMPAASGRPARLAPAPAPAPGSPPCELSAKGEPAGATWAAPGGPFASPTGDVAGGLGLSVDSGLQPQDKSKDLYWF
ncbi:transcription cofactor vestigial-like protein 2 isoform X7 [Balaenoptera ricei]|uniref:transcription cofactor vestigial-like protein 2 isoform X7 n=1 Tax=Balaenoptera ricei TaxID=2746895 RepID=UPI0028BE12CB|nr:transcription cofactor vestigial-like protein 2 isoform X7 [Balaenoptera ricei]